MHNRSTSRSGARTRASLFALAALTVVGVVAAPLSAAAAPGDRTPDGSSWGTSEPGAGAPDGSDLSSRGTNDNDYYVTRVDGANRYEVAVNLNSPFTSAEVMYVASGQKYADALSAGPAAYAQGGGLLLTPRDSLPEVTRQEILREKPKRIVVVGGTASVSDAVYQQLAAVQPDIVRIGGADRYEVSRNILEYAFEGGVSDVFIATGNNFPDALAAGPAAGHLDGAVLLVNGWGEGLDGPTRQSLADAGAQTARIAGGVNSVNAKVEADLAASIPSVMRYGGIDRFDVAANITLDIWRGKVENVFVASGLVFPDALATGPVAAEYDSPLLLTKPTCHPASTADAIWYSTLNPELLVFVGGPNTLSEELIDYPAYC
ncbi:cell wall-binding repeat-containing protein [Herbiconiux sp. CPCC 203407]|uniref:Cell wall-binding repeat-containing protein n=1 Tax=Herbiconiux oxytropis TaxID=2970915 RepID=A0AA41XGM8_9MICO|nr:cell wall-binding repeat-containing protein [Herbiconiux oxytropis]MCS5723300.1 cell wall-binding repeat-containing protein [Herbiconiux oxytropis]MCS5727842.1 cell wall-binding repeat-containing protein [Herbiconiux oxytropis]